MSATKKYKNSPLIEVICEFKFDKPNKTIEEIDTLFGSAIKEEYSVRSEKNGVIIDIKASELLTEKSIDRKKSSMYQYKNTEQNRLIQFSNDLLALNQLKPYVGWEDFCPIIIEKLALYKKMIGISRVDQIKLRYINRIEIPGVEGSISDYFKYSLQVPDEISKNLASIRLNSEHFCKNSRDVLSVSLYNTPSQGKSIDFIFDLNYVLIDKNQLKDQDVEDWLNDAHESINTIFEASLTEKCKLLFD